MTVSLTITIDRTSLSLSPLVLSGTDDANPIGVTRYVPPAKKKRLTYMPDSTDVKGSELVAKSIQQAILGFDFVADAADEADAQALFDEVEAALDQFSYTVTTQVSGAPAQVWDADPGDIQLAANDGRTTEDIVGANPEYAVSIPVYPIAS